MVPGLFSKKGVDTPTAIDPGMDSGIAQQAKQSQRMHLVHHRAMMPLPARSAIAAMAGARKTTMRGEDSARLVAVAPTALFGARRPGYLATA